MMLIEHKFSYILKHCSVANIRLWANSTQGLINSNRSKGVAMIEVASYEYLACFLSSAAAATAPVQLVAIAPYDNAYYFSLAIIMHIAMLNSYMYLPS